ncbi:uncharacterized protein LOC111271800 [Varroa jacobsoni]|uniref:Transmembrane protein n=1 Tax=Varroa destructor TaxID=109461 RepID=A0A7M7KS56_VARDE|nr:uncharacterized protein LOC111253659 isoform X2 [Varroa destructor]XP_022708536.1 uncharacterized protein LOC111271800 [Varroa jacobsoni]
MAYTGTKEGDEQEAMYRFLTPGEAEHQEADFSEQECVFVRKFRRLSVFYTWLMTPNNHMEETPACRALASCLVVAGFATGTALVILFFYLGFAYDIDEGTMLGMFALGSWLYGLVTVWRKTGCFRPIEDSGPVEVATEAPLSQPAAASVGTRTARQDPPSYKEVTKNPPSYLEALRMMKMAGAPLLELNAITLKSLHTPNPTAEEPEHNPSNGCRPS